MLNQRFSLPLDELAVGSAMCHEHLVAGKGGRFDDARRNLQVEGVLDVHKKNETRHFGMALT